MTKLALPQALRALLLVAATGCAQAGGLDSLEQYLRETRNGHAEFTQIVTAPGKDGQAGRSKNSSGSFDFARPNRFRFDYRKPFEQTIVADGQTLWLYDVDLHQVTARKQSAALASSPAAVIAAAADLKSLQAAFILSAAPAQDGLEWVQAVPKSRESMLQSVRVGFQGSTLAVLEILDSLGQRSVMRFTAMRSNGPVDNATFQFKPPAGVDLIQQ